MDDQIIFIPTRGRVNDQVTLNTLPAHLLKKVIIACHPGEKKLLNPLWGNKVKDIWEVEATHIGQVRQFCIVNASSDYITFVDDGLRFHIRADSEKTTNTKYPLKGIIDKHFYPETREQYKIDLFNWLHQQVKYKGYGMAGISRRANNFVSKNDTVENGGRICSFWSINRKLYNTLHNKPTFADMMLKEDFYITLHFLTNGIPIITSYKYAYERTAGANSPGGCSIYRKVESSNKSAIDLHKAFPDFVTLSTKGTKSWGGDFGDKSIDVIVNWKKAYEYGLNRKNNLKKRLI